MTVKSVFTLLLVLSFILPVGAQGSKKHRRKPSDNRGTGKVLVVGEAEARAAVLNQPSAADTQLQYQEFIAKVVAGYESAITLQPAESGSLTRTLLGLGPELPTRYKVHFAIGQWFREHIDAQRYEAWKQLDIYPEYQYAMMISTPGRTGK